MCHSKGHADDHPINYLQWYTQRQLVTILIICILHVGTKWAIYLEIASRDSISAPKSDRAGPFRWVSWLVAQATKFVHGHQRRQPQQQRLQQLHNDDGRDNWSTNNSNSASNNDEADGRYLIPYTWMVLSVKSQGFLCRDKFRTFIDMESFCHANLYVWCLFRSFFFALVWQIVYGAW